MDPIHIGVSGREEYANNAATLPVMTMLSEVPAPPMEASDAPSLRTSFRRNWSAPISTPRVPADVGQGEGEGLDLCLWAEAKRQQHGIPGAVQVTHGPGQRPRPTRLRTPAGEGPVSGAGRSATADSTLGPRCPRTGGHRPGTDTGAVNKNGGNPTDSGHSAHRRLHHGMRGQGQILPAWDDLPVDAVPDWDALAQPQPE